MDVVMILHVTLTQINYTERRCGRNFIGGGKRRYSLSGHKFYFAQHGPRDLDLSPMQ